VKGEVKGGANKGQVKKGGYGWAASRRYGDSRGIYALTMWAHFPPAPTLPSLRPPPGSRGAGR
jgi:hypothetical protein